MATSDADTGARNGRRRTAAKETTAEGTEGAKQPAAKATEPAKEDSKEFTAMPQSEANLPAPSLGGLATRPVDTSGIEIVESMMISGERPIAASHLDIYGMILNNRPIEATHLKVVDTDTIPGHRPIFASELHVLDMDTLPGHRPIVASDPHLMESSMLPGGRPIASNDIGEDSSGMMGYLD